MRSPIKNKEILVEPKGGNASAILEKIFGLELINFGITMSSPLLREFLTTNNRQNYG